MAMAYVIAYRVPRRNSRMLKCSESYVLYSFYVVRLFSAVNELKHERYILKIEWKFLTIYLFPNGVFVILWQMSNLHFNTLTQAFMGPNKLKDFPVT